LKQLDPSHHLINVGLALKEFSREAGPLLPNFNTLPTPYLPKPISLNRIMAIPTAVVAVSLILVLAMTIKSAGESIELAQNQLYTNNFIIEKKQAQKKQLTEEIAAAEQQMANFEASRKNFISILNNFNVNGERINKDLKAILDNQIDEFVIDSVSHSGSNLAVNGWAVSEQEVLQYVRKISTTGRFGEITINHLQRVINTEEGVEFMQYALNIELKG